MKKILLALALLLGLAAGAHAQAPQKDTEGFEPVNGDMLAPGETIPATTLVAAAYGFIFTAMLVYVGSVAMRTRRVEEELDRLRQRIETKKTP
jgi:hypothetical protein